MPLQEMIDEAFATCHGKKRTQILDSLILIIGEVKLWSFQFAFEMDLLKRTIVVALMPNILVWGFWMNGIDNDRHFLWRGLIGPYWFMEKTVFVIAGIGVLIFVGWKVWEGLAPVIAAAIQDYQEHSHQWEIARQDREFEAERHAEANRLKQERDERERQFLALPEAERNRIIIEKRRREEEKRRLAHEQYLEHVRNEEARLKLEADAKAKEQARHAAIANSPDTKRRKALEDITGGGF